MAVANYHEANGHFPPAYVVGPDGRPWHSWRVLVLPYVEGDDIFRAYDFKEPWDGPNNRKLADRMPRTYCFTGRSRPGNSVTNYLAVVGAGTLWPGAKSATRADVTDAPETTIHVAENDGAGVHWMEPRDLSFDDMDYRLNSPTGIGSWFESPAVAMLDGSVVRLKASLAPDTLRGMLTTRGGEKVVHTENGGWEVIPDGRLRPRRGP